MKRISDIPKAERPREKLHQLGAGSLSDTELIAVLLGSGTRKYDVMELSNRIIRAVDNSKGNPGFEKRVFCILLVDVCRVEVAGNPGKEADIRLGYGLCEFGLVAQCKFLDRLSKHYFPLEP